MKNFLNWIFGILIIFSALIVFFILAPRSFEVVKEKTINKIDWNKNKATPADCGDFVSGYHFPYHIKEIKWNKNNISILSVVGEEHASKVSYKISGNTISLYLRRKLSAYLYSGDGCRYNEIEIKGLANKDYNIKLYYKFIFKGYLLDELTFKASGEVEDYCDNENNSYECYSEQLWNIQNPEFAKKRKILEEANEEPKQFIYDTEEDRKIAESNPEFYRIFKKFDNYFYNDKSYNTIKFSFDNEAKSIRLFGINKLGHINLRTSLVSDANSFKDGIEKYIAEKKSLEPSDLKKSAIQEKLGVEVTKEYPDINTFDFLYKGEELQYCFSTSNITFVERKGANNIYFLDGLKEWYDLDQESLFKLIDLADRVYEGVNNYKNITPKSGDTIYIQPGLLKARFRSETDLDYASFARNMMIHNHDLIIRNPDERKFELDIISGEFRELELNEQIRD